MVEPATTISVKASAQCDDRRPIFQRNHASVSQYAEIVTSPGTPFSTMSRRNVLCVDCGTGTFGRAPASLLSTCWRSSDHGGATGPATARIAVKYWLPGSRFERSRTAAFASGGATWSESWVSVQVVAVTISLCAWLMVASLASRQ